MHKEALKLMPQMFVAIVNREKSAQLMAEFLQRHHMQLRFHCYGMGTASSEILDILGIGSTEKVIIIAIASGQVVAQVFHDLHRERRLMAPGKGIAFTIPMVAASRMVTTLLEDETACCLEAECSTPELQEQRCKLLESEVMKMKEESNFCLILSAVNQGYSEELMEAAKGAGAKGGTVIHVRGMGAQETMKVWGISVQEERELVLILAKRDQKTEIMQAISKKCGSQTEARGMIFALPVDGVEGLSRELYE